MLKSFLVGVCAVVPCGQPWRQKLALNSFRDRIAGFLAFCYCGPRRNKKGAVSLA